METTKKKTFRIYVNAETARLIDQIQAKKTLKGEKQTKVDIVGQLVERCAPQVLEEI